ncbi:MAG: hypothetical protein J5708_05790 [Bacteroidales bacterium]|nr:hypothetical protein [Bacteroidales bacterium]
MEDFDKIMDDLQTKRQSAHREFLGQLLVGGCALLGIQASLGNHHTDEFGIILYHAANIALALGILAVSAVLWSQVLIARQIEAKSHQAICNIREGKPYDMPTATPSTLARISQPLGFVFLLTGLFLVVVCQFFS